MEDFEPEKIYDIFIRDGVDSTKIIKRTMVFIRAGESFFVFYNPTRQLEEHIRKENLIRAEKSRDEPKGAASV